MTKLLERERSRFICFVRILYELNTSAEKAELPLAKNFFEENSDHIFSFVLVSD